MANYDISVIITAHHEGRLVHRTLQSVFNAIAYALKYGINSEVIVVLDNPNKETSDYFSSHCANELSIHTVSFGDAGSSRNYGVRLASGKYVAFLDGDDLFCETWLAKAYAYAEKKKQQTIFHPEYVVCFENENGLRQYIGTDDTNFNVLNLLQHNYWTSLIFTQKELFQHCRFIDTSFKGYGYEDWHWYCEAIAKGVQIRVVPETVFFYRRKKNGSRLSIHNESFVVIPPSRLFELKILEKLAKTTEAELEADTATDIFDSIISFRQIISVSLRKFVNVVCPSLIRILRRHPNLFRFAQLFLSSANHVKLQLPDWLIEEWKGIHFIEPQLFPDSQHMANIPYYEIPTSRIGAAYPELCRMCGENVSHIFVVAWLVRGGADMEVLNYIHALKLEGLAHEIIVVATENVVSPWAARLPEGVRFVEFGKLCSRLTAEEQELLLTRLLLQLAPQVIHNLNSQLCYRVFVKYGKALTNGSKLFVSTFCKDVTSEGQDAGYPYTYLPDCFDYLEAVYCDNQSFLNCLYDIYAYEKKKLKVHHHPFTITSRKNYTDRALEKGRIDILWAGRMDRQKRPDILAEIADKCQGKPFHFHVYGSSFLDHDIYSDRFKKLSNITTYGAYDGLPSLAAEKFDLFLYTSQWDGLPNILLEAISMGLPIVASDVGGISELIVNAETGYLIDPFDDVEKYVACLDRIFQDRTPLAQLVDRAYDLVATKHSWENFIADLKTIPSYVLQSSSK